MSDFKRENRYIVIKRSDLDGAVSDLPIKYQKKVWDQLGQVVSMPNKHRQNTGKSPLECVIVEHDWPEYDYVWKAIKHRMETGECLFEQQQARIAKLENNLTPAVIKEAITDCFNGYEDEVYSAQDLASHIINFARNRGGE